MKVHLYAALAVINAALAVFFFSIGQIAFAGFQAFWMVFFLFLIWLEKRFFNRKP